MSWLKRLLARARACLAAWLSPAYQTRIVDEALPPRLKRRVLFIVQEDGFEEQAAMMCPCGCRRVLHLNLLPDERPCWRVTQHEDGTASLHPSVWRKKGCQSHFWFRRGRVQWVRSSAGLPT